VSFADAALGGTPPEITAARDALGAAIGETALVDAAAVIAIFCANVRVADATGIPLDVNSAEARQRIGERVGIERFDRSEAAPFE